MKSPLVPRIVFLVTLAMGAGAAASCSRNAPEAAAPKSTSTPKPETKAEQKPVVGVPAKSAPQLFSTDDVPASIRAIMEVTGPERRQALEDLAGALARHDPQRAADLVKRMLAEQGEGSRDAYAVVSGFASDYAAMNPAAAAAWAEFLPLSLKFGALTFVAQQWARADLAGATTWAEGIGEPSLRAAMLRRISEELERSGEAMATGAWAKRLAGSADAAQHTETIARLWARTDVQGVFQWAAQVEEPARRTTAVVAIAAAVAEQDPRVAAAWIGQFPMGELRTQAAITVSAKWAKSDPKAALLWAESLGDPPLLEVVTRNVAPGWIAKNPEQATEWIQRVPISDQTKQYVLPGR